MKYQPLVSIIIPVYNGSNFVKEAIDSALSQTYENKEIIVVNDGSCDEGATEKIALSYGDKIRYIYKENGGVSSALNVGIKNMNGEYFSWLSHDDAYLPRKIELQIESLEKHNAKNCLILCDVQVINSESKVIKKAESNDKLKDGINEWHEALNYMLMYGSYNGCSLLIPKEAFEKSGGFDESLRYCQDAFMWAKMFLNKFDLLYVKETGVSNRVHNGQLTQRGRALFHKDSEAISLYLAPKIAEQNEYAKKLMYSYAYHNAVLGNKAVVKKCKKEAKERGLLTVMQRFRIMLAGWYGGIRPFIRRIYYRLFRRVKTK